MGLRNAAIVGWAPPTKWVQNPHPHWWAVPTLRVDPSRARTRCRNRTGPDQVDGPVMGLRNAAIVGWAPPTKWVQNPHPHWWAVPTLRVDPSRARTRCRNRTGPDQVDGPVMGLRNAAIVGWAPPTKWVQNPHPHWWAVPTLRVDPSRARTRCRNRTGPDQVDGPVMGLRNAAIVGWAPPTKWVQNPHPHWWAVPTLRVDPSRARTRCRNRTGPDQVDGPVMGLRNAAIVGWAPPTKWVQNPHPHWWAVPTLRVDPSRARTRCRNRTGPDQVDGPVMGLRNAAIVGWAPPTKWVQNPHPHWWAVPTLRVDPSRARTRCRNRTGPDQVDGPVMGLRNAAIVGWAPPTKWVQNPHPHWWAVPTLRVDPSRARTRCRNRTAAFISS
jgi:hypothetical protein